MQPPKSAPVSLVVPAEARSIRIVRTLTSAIASSLALPYDTVEDLRIATTEACTLLLSSAAGGPAELTVNLWPEADKLVIAMSVASGSTATVPSEDLSWQVIRGLTDESEMAVVEGRQTLTMVVHTLAPAPS